MTSAPIDPLIGRTLDERYLVRSRIARGGMAMVYLANDLRLERKVAVKVMHEHLAEDENFARRFDREARSAARLSHANLVNVFDQGHDFGRTYLVMEYLPSITLRELLKKQRRLTLDQSLEIADAVLAGLAAAHSAGIVHRDLKPENVLLVDDGRIKIGDFGLARAVSANTTTGQALLGTIAYLSPELVTRGVADERSDLYAFGIMLFEMLTGTQPFTGEQPMQIAYQHAHSEVPVPSERTDDSPPPVDEFVRWLTHRDPALRPADAGEAFEVLAQIRRDPYTMPQGFAERIRASGGLAGAGSAAATTALPTTALQTAAIEAAGDEPEAFSDVTSVLPSGAFADGIAADDIATTRLTPSTTVLDPAQQSALGAGAAAAGAVAGGALALGGAAAGAVAKTAASSASISSAVDRVRAAGARRSRRGRMIAAVLALLVAVAGGVGYWFGQGPGSQVTVPHVAGKAMKAAQAELKSLDLVVDVAQCSSLTVAAGLAASTDPKPGTRLDRGSTVTLCQSTGPEMLEVPQLVGIQSDAAIALIKQHRFNFGSIIDRRFSSDAADGIVLAALDEHDQELGATFPEQGVINLIVSVGPLPDVHDVTVDQATKTLAGKELTVDSALNTESYDEAVPEGKVIGVVTHTDPVKPGDSVGLKISKGPEPVTVPDVRGMNLKDAMQKLKDAGLSPTTAVPEIIWGIATVTGTNPAAGQQLKKGSEVRVTSSL